MISNRKNFKLMPLSVSPVKQEKNVLSLKEIALTTFAKSKAGLFTPTEIEHCVLMAAKDDLPHHIKTLPELLCRYAAWGMQTEAEELLKSLNPALLESALKQQITVKDYAGRQLRGTALELAIKMSDVTHHEEYECMAEMLARFMRCIDQGHTIVNKQVANVFGDNIDEQLAKQEQCAYKFDSVVNAINAATAEQLQSQLTHKNDDGALNKTIIAFRKQLNEISLQEEIFNPHHTFNALKTYNENFADWNWEQRKLFWRQVVGEIQRYWPRCWLQAMKTGIMNLTHPQACKKLDRSVNVINYHSKKIISLDEIDSDDSSRLGRDFAIYSAIEGGAVSSRAECEWLIQALQTLCTAKVAALKNLAKPKAQHVAKM